MHIEKSWTHHYCAQYKSIVYFSSAFRYAAYFCMHLQSGTVDISCGAYLTFNLQEDVVLLHPQVVGGDARVLPAVQRLGHVDLQSTVLVDHIRVAVLNAGLTVFEPTQEKKKRWLFINIWTFLDSKWILDGCESYHVIVGIGEPKEAQCSKARLLAMTLYTWLGGVSTLGDSAMGRSTTCLSLFHHKFQPCRLSY